MLTQEKLKHHLFYDQDSGIFTWIKPFKRGQKIGCIAGVKHNRGYWAIQFNKRSYLAHRLAWLYVYGEFPENYIDHIDGVRNNNKIENLRLATGLQNSQNRKLPSNNTSSYIGVYFKTMANKWCAKIDFESKRYYLGNHATAELAYMAYKEAKARLHAFNPVVR